MPLQRHPPALVLGAALVEIAVFVAVFATGSTGVLLALVVVAGGFLALGRTNRRRLLALYDDESVILSADNRGKPEAVVGPGPRDLLLPEPRGLGVRVQLDETTWWVDRWAFPLLRRARERERSGDDE